MNWNDNVGAEQTYLSTLLDNAAPPSDFGLSASEQPVPSPFTFLAIAGQPVSYFVLGPGDNNGGTYELVLVVEQLTPCKNIKGAK